MLIMGRGAGLPAEPVPGAGAFFGPGRRPPAEGLTAAARRLAAIPLPKSPHALEHALRQLQRRYMWEAAGEHDAAGEKALEEEVQIMFPPRPELIRLYASEKAALGYAGSNNEEAKLALQLRLLSDEAGDEIARGQWQSIVKPLAVRGFGNEEELVRFIWQDRLCPLIETHDAEIVELYKTLVGSQSAEASRPHALLAYERHHNDPARYAAIAATEATDTLQSALGETPASSYDYEDLLATSAKIAGWLSGLGASVEVGEPILPQKVMMSLYKGEDPAGVHRRLSAFIGSRRNAVILAKYYAKQPLPTRVRPDELILCERIVAVECQEDADLSFLDFPDECRRPVSWIRSQLHRAGLFKLQ